MEVIGLCRSRGGIVMWASCGESGVGFCGMQIFLQHRVTSPYLKSWQVCIGALGMIASLL